MDQQTNDKLFLSSAQLITTISSYIQAMQNSKELQANLENLSQALSKITTSYVQTINVISPALIKFQQEITPIVSEWAKMKPMYQELLATAPPITLTPVNDSSDKPETVVTDAIITAQKAIPYVKDGVDETQITVLSASAKAPRAWWNFDRVLALMNLLIMLYFGILQAMPSKQMEEIIEQNEVIIENQERLQAETEKSNEDIREILQDINDSIEALSDKLDTLRETPDLASDNGELVSDSLEDE